MKNNESPICAEPNHAAGGQCPGKMAALTWIKGNPSPYQSGDITHFPDWRSLIVLDAFFNNLGSGLMIAAAIIWGAGPSIGTFALPFAMTAALFIIAIDLLLLTLDLGDPFRFTHSMRVMRLTSPLSVGVWGLVSFSCFLALAALLRWLLWFGGPSPIFMSLANLFTVMAIIGAVVVICYKGVVFSCSSQPGLRQARWLPPFMVADSLLMGLAAYILVALACGMGRQSLILVPPLAFLLVARCAAFGLLWQDVKTRARRVYREENRIIAIAVFGFAGILPMFLPFLGIWGMLLAAILILACGIFERAWIIGLARPVKKP